MQILNQTVLATLESSPGIYSISNDYSLNGATLSIPSGKTLYFNGGSISNGTLSLNGTLLNNLEDDSINARIVGTILNTVIYTSQIGGINNLGLSDYSGMTIYCDYPETNVTTGIVLSGTNLNGSGETIFDGLNNDFPCSANKFFQFENGAKNVTIRNFKSTHLTPNTSSQKFFVYSNDANANYTNIKVIGNQIKYYNVGISLSNEKENNNVCYCQVKNNQIEDCLGTDPGYGYGIHLANAHNCTVSGNSIRNSQRHAIYHAWGSYNEILNNSIFEFRKNLTDYVSQAALDISRKSSHITVSHNTFSKCNGVCLMIYTCTPASESGFDSLTHLFRYGNAEDIVITDNVFTMAGLTGNLDGLSFIMVGYATESYAVRAAANTLIMNVEIKNNVFSKYNSNSQKCIRIDQCKVLVISNNIFSFKLPDSPGASTYRIINFTDSTTADSVMTATVSGNNFIYNGTNPGANIFIIGDDVSLFSSSINPNYIIVWTGNTLQNQYVGGTTNYYLYEGIPGDNLIIS